MKVVIGLAVKLLIIGFVRAAVDYNICYGQHQGTQIPNNQNCATYYVCNHGYPELFRCQGNLLFDMKTKVCNWPDQVTCEQVIGNPSPPIIQPAPQPQPEPQPQPPPQIIVPPENPDTQPIGPPQIEIEDPSIGIIGEEYYPGVVIQADKPNKYACNRAGFYFVPHPNSCEEYFICENYRIHEHQCGPGIHWDYIFAQCDFPQKSHCFGGAPLSNLTINDYDDDNSVQDEIVYMTTAASTIGVTGPIQVDLPSNLHEITTDKLPDCPGDQAFYPFAKDCHKYYICIGGIPILTSCPDGMNWDADGSQCGDEDTTVCLRVEGI